MAKKQSTNTIRNKRASFDYDIKDTLLAGLVLTGAETRSLREHHGSLQGAFVQIKDNEAWLVNALITPLKTNVANLPSERKPPSSPHRCSIAAAKRLMSLVFFSSCSI